MCDELLTVVKMLLEGCRIQVIETEEPLPKERERHQFFELDTSSSPEVYVGLLCDEVTKLIAGLFPGNMRIANLCLYRATPEQMRPGPLACYTLPLCLSWKQSGEYFGRPEPFLLSLMTQIKAAILSILATDGQEKGCLSQLQKLQL